VVLALAAPVDAVASAVVLVAAAVVSAAADRTFKFWNAKSPGQRPAIFI